ncbi:MAG: glycosyltransferase [Rhodospirillales bacterium]|jgi:GT2 family glycosyltransferase|nr:glycosyltransferase [Rhodospirillales bacterium]
MPTPPAQLAIAVGTFNRLDHLRTLLDSIERQTRTPYEIHVCDAGSTDGTAAWLRRRAEADPRIHPVFDGARRGQAAALNDIFRRLTTPWTGWLSDDNIVIDGGLDVAVAALAADPLLGMVGLKVRDLRGPFAAAPYIGGLTGTGVLNINQGVLPTPLLQELGGFSVDFGDYGIDADLTTRVLLAGRSVALTRAVCVHHNRNWASSETNEGIRLAERNARYRSLYMQIYSPLLGADCGWMLRRAAWKALRRIFPRRLALDSARPVGGFLVRDWHNMIAGRFISIRRELGDRGSAVHLVQRCPRRSARPKKAIEAVS